MANKPKNKKKLNAASTEQSVQQIPIAKDKREFQALPLKTDAKVAPWKKHKSYLFWEKYQAHILSFVLSICGLPARFSYSPDNSIDASWKIAMNLAIKKNLQFGKDFIFTYGPLGYLSSRYTQYINDIFLLLSDIFVCLCFYYIFNKLISRNKGWFFIILLAIFHFRGTEAAETYFLLFIIFAIINFQDTFGSYFELICCALCGTVVFFIKINYGLFALPILLLLSGYLLLNNKKSFIVFLSCIVLIFCVIFSFTNVNIGDYIKNSIPLISNYGEAMVLELDPWKAPFISVILYSIAFLAAIFVYLLPLWKHKDLSFAKIFPPLLLCLMFFLMYKNGFTRNDEIYCTGNTGHNDLFFLSMPLFLIFVLLLLNFGHSIAARVVCVCALVLSDYNMKLPQYGEVTNFIYNATITPTISYFNTILKKVPDTIEPLFKLPDDKLKLIGQSSIDVFPWDILIMQKNNLNYSPRPVIQSYSAYSPLLDSLNANHFYQKNSPEFVLFSTRSIDSRYPTWDEPLTNAVLHLNYEYVDFVSLNSESSLANSTFNFLLLKSKTENRKYPKFEKLYEKTINLEDTFQTTFPDSILTYMTADIEYYPLAKIKNILFLPPLLSISMFYDSTYQTALNYKIIRPSLMEPALISKSVCNNTEFKNFITGNLRKNRTVKAFAIHANGIGCKKSIKLTFYKFSNYQFKNSTYESDATSLIQTATSFKDKKQYDSAIFYFNMFLARSPFSANADIELGNIYLEMQAYDSAENHLKKAQSLSPGNPVPVMDLGVVYFSTKKYPKALLQFKKVVSLDPKSIKGYSDLGRTYFVLEQYNDAIENFEKAHSLDPNQTEDIGFLALSYKKTGKTDSAKKYEAIAKKYNPGFKL